MSQRDSLPSLEAIRSFWEEHPVGERLLGPQQTAYDYFRAYDNVRESWEREPPDLLRELHDFDSAAGKHVLDYGCGNGYVLAQYARHGANVYGVDVTERAVELATERFELLGLEGTFVRNDGVSIPFESDSFDVACSLGVLHHIPHPEPVVEELHRVLKPGGKLIVMLYNRDSWRYRVEFRGRQELVTAIDGRENPYGRVYSRDEARRLLAAFEEHRFLVCKLGFADLALWRPRAERVVQRLVPRRAVDRLGRRYGWNLYCFARKPPTG